MNISDLKGRKTVIWGVGREGRAAAAFITSVHSDQNITFVDDSATGEGIVSGADNIRRALLSADIIVKSPGVSLYHPLMAELRQHRIPVTSLLNLWLGTPHRALTICVTGTKGKSTTSSLLAHTLRKLGRRVALAGNIGVPVCEISPDDFEIVVIETSSFQAADLYESCDVAVLTSLYEDHIDWHGSRAQYHQDKLNLLSHARHRIANAQSRADAELSNTPEGIHAQGCDVYQGDVLIGPVGSAYLSRPHNLENVCTVLTVLDYLGFDLAQALAAMVDFAGLPHRQQELGEKNGVLYVDDSISTTAYSAIAALETYAGRDITLIAGGFDRGIDYTPLLERLKTSSVRHIILLGPSGERLLGLLNGKTACGLHPVASMPEAVAAAQAVSVSGSVILLSPGAPSYGLFRDFIERGQSFARASGFAA